MFRDESSKVMQKAHAQWGYSEPMNDRAVSIASPSSENATGPLTLAKSIDPTMLEKGVQFYIDRYLIGHPGEPKTVDDLPEAKWMLTDGMDVVMAALGLGALSNLTKDPEITVAAREKYGQALMLTAKSLQSIGRGGREAELRSVIMLAQFEVSSPK
jgi:hypothetical protein